MSQRYPSDRVQLGEWARVETPDGRMLEGRITAVGRSSVVVYNDASMPYSSEPTGSIVLSAGTFRDSAVSVSIGR